MRAAITPCTSPGSGRHAGDRWRSSHRLVARARPPRSASAGSPRGRTDFPRPARGSARGRPSKTRSPPRSAATSRRAFARVERRQVEGNRVLLARTPARADLEKLRPRRADDQDAVSARLSARCSSEVEERLRGPVDVLDREDGRAARGRARRCSAPSASYRRRADIVDGSSPEPGSASPIVQAAASITRSAWP